MKAILFLTLVACSLSLPSSARADSQMVAANERVQIEVRVKANDDRKDLPKTSTDAVTQHKTLEISLSGKFREGDTRMVKWTAFGKNMKNDNIRALGTGEFKLALDSHGMSKGESKEITCSYTPEHTEVENAKGRARAGAKNANTGPRTKRVDAEGEKFIGYSVQVLDGTKVVGEAADPIGIGDKR